MNDSFELPLDEKGFLLMESVEQNYQAYKKSENYDLALKYLNHIKDQGNLTNRHDMIHVHDLYIDLLLSMEDYPSLLSILKSKEKYLESKKEKNMHLFYLAIAYEGLNQINQAIEALNQIEDILSRKNMANKYIKLAILYAQTKQISQAKKALKHAEIFDRERQNDMFLLAESDIAYYEQRYIDAMQVYEDFFIQSKRKLSYLNRFIRISNALDRKKDAYDFFKRYQKMVEASSSIQSKLLFYQESLPVLKIMDQDAYIDVHDLIQDIKSRPIIDFDHFNYFNLLLTHIDREKIYHKKRDIIRDLLIDLQASSHFYKLAYAKYMDGQLHLKHLSKSLLLDKDINIDHPIMDDFKSDHIQNTYHKDMIQDFIFVDDDVDILMIEHVQDQSYLLAFIKDTYYDISKKLLILSSKLLKQKLIHYDLLSSHQALSEGLKHLLNQKKLPFIKIHKNQIFLLNESAKTFFGLDENMLQYDLFQDHMNPKIYMDEFQEKTRHETYYKDRHIVIYSQVVGFDVYALIEDIKEVVLDEPKQNDQESVIELVINNHRPYIESFGFDKYLSDLKAFIESLNQMANHHIIYLELEAHHVIFIQLDTVDKRIFERLYDKIKKDFSLFDVRMSYQRFNLSWQDMKEKLTHMIALTSKEQATIAKDALIKKEEHINHLYMTSIQTMIQQKQITLKHQFIKDWSSNEIAFVDVTFHHDILTNKKRINQIFANKELAILFDRLMVNQLIVDVKNDHKPMSFILAFTRASIQSSKAFNYLLRRIKLLENHQIIFKFHLDDYLSLSHDDLKHLEDKGFKILIDLQLSQILTVKSIHHQDLVMVHPDIIEDEDVQAWMMILHKRFDHIIYDHHEKTLMKKQLKNLNIHYVKGGFAGGKIFPTK